jgi:opine dehydrogenase
MNQNGAVTTIAVIGAGSGGFGLIANLGVAGYRLRLIDRDEGRLTAIRERGGVDVENGPRPFAAVDLATTDLAVGVEGADLIILATGGHAQAAAARSLAPLLGDGQIVLLIQGNTGGSLIVRQELERGGCRATVDVAEMDTYPYATARLEPSRARIITGKRWLQIAAFPGRRGAAVMEQVGPLFPKAVLAPNILATGLTNMNAVLHVANCVANAGRIETGGNFRFYAEGVTPAVANLYSALDAERAALATRLGVSVPAIPEWIERAYGIREPSLHQTFERLTFDEDGPYRNTPTPISLDHNYVAEDVPTGLVPMRALAAAAGVATPVLESLIHVACVMAGRDFADSARTIERLGLTGQNAAQIQATVRDGFGQSRALA